MPSGPSRRSFLGRASAALALLLATDTDAAEAGPRSAPRLPQNEWDDAWLRRLTRPHRQIFDIPGHLNGGVLGYVRNYLNGLEASGIPASDIQAVLGLHGTALVRAMGDSLWAKYKLGETYRINDPRTSAPSTRNLWVTADNPNSVMAQLMIPALQARGVEVLICNNVLNGMVGGVARRENLPVADVRADFVANLLPGVVIVPAMVAAFNRAQLAGCSYAYAGLAGGDPAA